MQDQDKDLTGKVALVTGGSRRIGAQIARRLHQEGMNLILHYHSSDQEARTLQSELNDCRENSVVLIKGDLLDKHKITHLVHKAANVYSRLDALVNNASTFFPTPVGSTSEQDWHNLIGTNLKAPFFLSQAAAQDLKERNGCIVNIAIIPIPQFSIGTCLYFIIHNGVAIKFRFCELVLLTPHNAFRNLWCLNWNVYIFIPY